MSILHDFGKSMEKVKESLKDASDKKISLNNTKKDSFIFSKRKENYYASSIEKNIKDLIENGWKLTNLVSVKSNREPLLEILNLLEDIKTAYSEHNFQRLNTKIKNLESISQRITDNTLERVDYSIPRTLNVPGAIRDEVFADLNELRACFSSNLFRSSVILCGRILEVALHRKYYEVTKNDILETQPGIGLGKLVAKLYEKKVLFDPGINEQIHLINKVRIHSVHKKQEIFKTTREQTYATILYTLDVVNRLFD